MNYVNQRYRYMVAPYGLYIHENFSENRKGS